MSTESSTFRLRPTVQRLWATDALLPQGWARDVMLEWDEQGRLLSVECDADVGAQQAAVADGRALPFEVAAGPVVPGMPNLHSHAFQRAFAGLTERRAAATDSFWSWREAMYRFALAISPEQLEAVACWLYLEMLEAGYTSVCEFHYLHHDVDGRPYPARGADDATMAMCLMRAAAEVGIGMTMLPVLYQTAGFGNQPPLAEQRRFVRSTDSMIGLLASLKPVCDPMRIRLGLAPHSLRAVPPDSLRDALAGLHSIDATAPIHLHIAEQTAEVEACLAHHRQRPLEWLLDHVEVDQRWCLVHATHLSDDERRRGALTGAVVGLCPTTEANLGDGLFDAVDWTGQGGAWGIGSDSHVCVNPAEELMMLEYGLRLTRRQRNVLIEGEAAKGEVATSLWLAAVAGGARASARPISGLAPGQQADLVILDGRNPLIEGLSAPDALAAHVFASHRRSAIDEVWTAGRPRIIDGRHDLHEAAAAAFVQARAALKAGA